MKKTKLFGWAFVAYMMGANFSACSNDAEEVLTQENEIKLTSEITPSRAASNLQSTQIVAGQEVGVTITGIKEGQEHNNIAWSVGDNGALTNTGDAVYYGDGTATITAYHPFNDDWDESTTYAFSVSTDQSTNAEYLASDLLWATASSEKTENAIPLPFSHKLAKINVTLVPEEDDDDLNGATISIYGTKTSTTFNPTTGVISDATGEPQDIIAGVTTDDAYTASAIVIPQEVSGKFIKITHEGKTYYYTLASAKTLEAGTSYSFTLTVKGKQLINTGSSINPWNPDSEEGEEGDAEEDVSKLTVTLTEAGTLGNYLTDANKDIVEELKIIGNINATDIQLLRNIAICNGSGNPIEGTTGALISLDLSEANIVEGGGTYNGHSKEVSTINNVVTEEMFEYTNFHKIILPNNITEIKGSAFEGMKGLTTLVIPEGVITIGVEAFNCCENLISISIPETVTNIGQYAFDVCRALTSIKIPSKVTVIQPYTFNSCSSLESVKLPVGITEIGNFAFAGCKSLNEFHCKAANPPTINAYTFQSANTSNCTLYVPTASVNSYKANDYWKAFTNIEGE